MDKVRLEDCPGCKSRLFGPVKFCPFCGKNVKEIPPPPPPPSKYGPVIKGLSISASERAGRVVVTAIAHSEDGLNIAGAEWWIGNDQGPGKCNPMEPVAGSFKSSRVDIRTSVDISKFKPGNYAINVRSKDVRGVWGSPQTITLTVPIKEQTKSPSPPPPLPPKGPVIKGLSISALGKSGQVVVRAFAYSEDGLSVKQAEYWIGNDPGPGNGTRMKAVQSPFKSSRVNITASVDTREHKPGKYPINVRSADLRGVWGGSQTITLTVKKPKPPRRHLLRNVIVGILIAACLFIGYKIISKSKEKAQLSVATIPSGASLTIDGKNRGRTPIAGLSIDPGPHRIVLEKDGYSRTVRDLSLVPREKKSLKISLFVSKPPPKPLGKERAEELVAKGVSSEEAGKLDEALILYREAREIYPDFPRINELIVDVQTKIRAQRRAEAEARRRKKAEELVGNGASSEEAGRFEEALRLYREAKETYPDFPRINELIVDVQRKIEEHNRGKKADANNHVENDLREAIAAYDNSQYDVAIKMCQSILRKDPNNSTAQQYLQKAKEQQEKAINNLLSPGSVKKIK